MPRKCPCGWPRSSSSSGKMFCRMGFVPIAVRAISPSTSPASGGRRNIETERRWGIFVVIRKRAGVEADPGDLHALALRSCPAISSCGSHGTSDAERDRWHQPGARAWRCPPSSLRGIQRAGGDEPGPRRIPPASRAGTGGRWHAPTLSTGIWLRFWSRIPSTCSCIVLFLLPAPCPFLSEDPPKAQPLFDALPARRIQRRDQ